MCRSLLEKAFGQMVSLDGLGEVSRRHGWIISAFVLMKNHFHLLIDETPEANLSGGMKWLHGSNAGWYSLVCT